MALQKQDICSGGGPAERNLELAALESPERPTRQDQSTALLAEATSGPGRNMGSDMYSGVLSGPTATEDTGSKVDVARRKSNGPLRVTAKVTTYAGRRKSSLVQTKKEGRVRGGGPSGGVHQQVVLAPGSRQSSGQRLNSTQKRTNENSPSLSQTPIVPTASATGKRYEVQYQPPLGSQIGKLNGTVADYHARQRSLETEQRRFEELVDEAMHERMTRPEPLLQRHATMDAIPKMKDLAYGGQRSASNDDEVNSDIYTDSADFHAIRPMQAVALKPVTTLTDHQLAKLDALKAMKNQRMFANKGNDNIIWKQSSSQPISSMSVTARDAATVGSQYGLKGSFVASSNEVDQWIHQTANLGAHYKYGEGLVTSGKSSPTKMDAAVPKLIDNLQSALKFTKMPISDAHLQKLKEAAMPESRSSDLPTKKSTKPAKRRDRQATSSHGTAGGQPSRGPTPPPPIRNDSVSNNMDLAAVHPTSVVIGSALAISKKELNRKVDQHAAINHERHGGRAAKMIEKATSPQTPYSTLSSLAAKSQVTRNIQGRSSNYQGQSGRLEAGYTSPNTLVPGHSVNIANGQVTGGSDEYGTQIVDCDPKLSTLVSPSLTSRIIKQQKPHLKLKSSFHAQSRRCSATGRESLTLPQKAPATMATTTLAAEGAAGLQQQPHYKLSLKRESYSQKGFGNGFTSSGDRFTGVNEAKFQIITWFKNKAVEQAGSGAGAAGGPPQARKKEAAVSHPKQPGAGFGAVQAKVFTAAHQQPQARGQRKAMAATGSKAAALADPAALVAGERAVQKQLKSQRRLTEANNVQEVIKVNQEQMRSGQYIGRCLKSHLPFPHNIINEKRNSQKQLKKQKEIPKQYITMSSGFKSQQPRFLATVVQKKIAKEDAPGPGHYDIEGGELKYLSSLKQKSMVNLERHSVKPVSNGGRNPAKDLLTQNKNYRTANVSPAKDNLARTIYPPTSDHQSISNSMVKEQAPNDQLVMSGTSAYLSQVNFNIISTWNAEQWKSQLQQQDPTRQSTYNEMDSWPLRPIHPKGSFGSTQRISQSPRGESSFDVGLTGDPQPVTAVTTVQAPQHAYKVSNFSQLKDYKQQVESISSAQAELASKADLSKVQKDKILQILGSAPQNMSSTGTEQFQVSRRSSLAPTSTSEQEDPFSISSRLKQKMRNSLGSGVYKQIAGFTSNHRHSAISLRAAQSISITDPRTPQVQSTPCLNKLAAAPSSNPQAYTNQSFKKSILENSTRILLGNKPGKKKKKRRLEKDVAIWHSTSAPNIEVQNAADLQEQHVFDELPGAITIKRGAHEATLDVRKLPLPSSGQKLTNYLIKHQTHNEQKQSSNSKILHAHKQQSEDQNTQAQQNNVKEHGLSTFFPPQNGPGLPFGVHQKSFSVDSDSKNGPDESMKRSVMNHSHNNQIQSFQQQDQPPNQIKPDIIASETVSVQQPQTAARNSEAYQQILQRNNLTTNSSAERDSESRSFQRANYDVAGFELIVPQKKKNKNSQKQKQFIGSGNTSDADQGRDAEVSNDGGMPQDVEVARLEPILDPGPTNENLAVAQAEFSLESRSLLSSLRGDDREIAVCQLDQLSGDDIDGGGGVVTGIASGEGQTVMNEGQSKAPPASTNNCLLNDYIAAIGTSAPALKPNIKHNSLESIEEQLTSPNISLKSPYVQK